MRRRVTVIVPVCVCVCVAVKSHLTSEVSVRPENTVTYSAGNGGQIICGGSLKPLHCGDPALPPLKAIHTVGYFSCRKYACTLVLRAMNILNAKGSAL